MAERNGILTKKTEEKFITACGELIKPGDRILVGLSGGPDSVILLSLLEKFKRNLKVEFGAAHVNHSLRGDDSDGDEQFCKEFSEKLDIPFFSINADVKGYAEKTKMSLEEAGREIRYEFFSTIAEQNGFTKIATAHNLDDNTETILLNLAKGTGMTGLMGIPRKRGNIIRPLLMISKEEIMKWLEENAVAFRIDHSNQSNEYQRNVIRNKIISVLKDEVNPKLSDAVYRMSQIISESNAFINHELLDGIPDFLKREHGNLLIKNSLYDKYGNEFSGIVLRLILTEYFSISPDYNDVAQLKYLFGRQKGTKIEIGSSIFAIRETEGLLLYQYDPAEDYYFELNPGESVSCELFSIELSGIIKINKEPVFCEGCEYLRTGSKEEKYIVRPWKDGDIFMPLGMNSHKKMSDFLTDAKVTSLKKRNWPVIEYSGKIVYAAGLRISEEAKIEPGMQECIAVKFIWKV